MAASFPGVCEIQPGVRIDRLCDVCGHTGFVHTRHGCAICDAVGELRAAVVVPAFCNIFWGSHGCDLPVGHDGGHVCDCGSEAADTLVTFSINVGPREWIPADADLVERDT